MSDELALDAPHVANRARLYDEGLERALVNQAKLVARLSLKLRRQRATVKRLDYELRSARKLLRELTRQEDHRP